MQGILQFNRSEPEEERSFQRACNADVYYGILWDISQDIFRAARKYGTDDPKLKSLGEEHQEAIIETIEYLESKFYQLLEENNISLD